jgi:hypothetical protein
MTTTNAPPIGMELIDSDRSAQTVKGSCNGTDVEHGAVFWAKLSRSCEVWLDASFV